MRKDTINRWQHDDGINYFDFFEPAMREYTTMRFRRPYPLPHPCRSAVEMTLRVAVIGLGPIGNRHAKLYLQDPLAELVGVCDM